MVTGTLFHTSPNHSNRPRRGSVRLTANFFLSINGEGRRFHVFTDHKPIMYAIHTRSDKHSPHQAKHLDFIAQFTSDLRHVKANALLTSPPPVLDFKAMAAAQNSDPDIQWQKSKVQQHTITPLSTFSTLGTRVHVDLVGPLPTSNVYICSLVLTISCIGPKSSPSLTLPLYMAGSPALVSHRPSQPTTADNLNQDFGNSWLLLIDQSLHGA